MLSPHGICQDCITYSTKKCVSYKCVKDSKMMSLLAAKENNFNKRHHFYDKINLFIAENEFYKKLMVTSKFTSSPIISMINFLPLNQVYEISPFHKKYILYFGRFSKEKGILTLLNAFKDLSVDNQLIIVGAGPQEEIIKDYILKERIPNIELPGPIYGQKMEEIIIESEMVVLPSEWYENCPYALLQAMAKGKPVICSNIGGLPEILGPELKELLFEKGNPNDLQKKMSSVLSMSNTEYDFLSHKVLHRAKEISDAESYGRKLMKEYNKLVEKTK
jgi:glycosyltransferase involved in cell wall biosynthesis